VCIRGCRWGSLTACRSREQFFHERETSCGGQRNLELTTLTVYRVARPEVLPNFSPVQGSLCFLPGLLFDPKPRQAPGLWFPSGYNSSPTSPCGAGETSGDTPGDAAGDASGDAVGEAWGSWFWGPHPARRSTKVAKSMVTMQSTRVFLFRMLFLSLLSGNIVALPGLGMGSGF
jgi:hypothetical protein